MPHHILRQSGQHRAVSGPRVQSGAAVGHGRDGDRGRQVCVLRRCADGGVCWRWAVYAELTTPGRCGKERVVETRVFKGVKEGRERERKREKGGRERRERRGEARNYLDIMEWGWP